MGRRTGLKSYRSAQWRNYPRTGTPPGFDSYAEYEHIVETLVRANAIQDASKIWWDVRPHHLHPTLEFRICDICTRVEEATCLAAIFQAIVAKFWKLRRDNLTFRTYPMTLLSENKWRAARYGLDGNLFDLDDGTERPVSVFIHELIHGFLDDVLDDLGSRKEVEYAFEILQEGVPARTGSWRSSKRQVT